MPEPLFSEIKLVQTYYYLIKNLRFKTGYGQQKYLSVLRWWMFITQQLNNLNRKIL